MFVSKSMTGKVITVSKDDDILDAREKMDENHIHNLPVVDDNNRLIGVVTDRDIRSVLPYDISNDDIKKEYMEKSIKKKIEDIMTKNPVSISPEYTIQDALLLIQKLGVGALPVIDDKGVLKGILSVKDLLRAFINVLGIGEPGTLLCILVEEKIGVLKKIVDAITEENISFGSVLVARHWEKNKRVVFPYLLTQNVAHIKRKLKKLGYTLLDPLEWHMDQLTDNE